MHSIQQVKSRNSINLGSAGTILILVLVITVALAAHWPVLSAGAFCIDDDQYLLKNSLVQKPGWNSVSRFFSEVLAPSTVRGYYQPITMTSLMLDYSMGGRPDNLRAFHVTNLVLHLSNVTLVFFLILSLLRNGLAAGCAGLLFAIHPLTVEPIAWIAERKTLLATSFALVSILIYMRYVRKGTFTCLGLALAAYVLAVVSKPTAVPLPVLLLVLDFWPLSRISRKSLVEKIPLFLVAIASGLLSVASQARTATIVTQSDWGQVILKAIYLPAFYFAKIAWPLRLTPIYALPEPFSLSNPAVLLAAGATVCLALVALFSLRKTRSLAFGFLFFLVAVSPTLGFLKYTWMIASDKYVYFPAVGLVIVLAWSFRSFLESSIMTPAFRMVALAAITIALATAEGTILRRQLNNWRNTIALYEHMAALNPGSPDVQNNLGDALLEAGREEDAIRRFRRALELVPRPIAAMINLANVLISRDQLEEAIRLLNDALEIDPDSAVAHLNLASAYEGQKRSELAIEHYRIVLQRQPANLLARRRLSRLLVQTGRMEEAVSTLDAGMEIQPDSPELQRQLGWVLLRTGDYQKADRLFDALVKKRPDDAAAQYLLGCALFGEDRVKEGLDHWRQAVTILKDWAAVMNSLAWVLATHPDERCRNGLEAVQLARRACEARPQDPAALDTLAAAYAETGDFEKAILAAEQAAKSYSDQGDTESALETRERLELFKKGDAYREPVRIDALIPTTPPVD